MRTYGWVRRAAASLLAVLLVVVIGACSTPERLTVPIGEAEQLIVVTSSSWAATTGFLSTYERSGQGWQLVHAGLPVRLGRNGFSADHREGDGTTPAGSFPITGIMGRQPDPGVHFPYRQLVPGDCWISDSSSPSYNQLVSASPCQSPNEDVYAIGAGAYRYLATTGYNTSPAVPGAGSAIFLHRHSYDGGGSTLPTSGCVSLAEPDLLAVLRWLDPAKHPRIVMGPDSWLLRPESPGAPPAAAPAPPAGSPSPSAGTVSRVLSIGASGEDVAVLQRALTATGFAAVADGRFGSQTYAAVVAYQRAKGLYADGIVGPQTGRALGIWAG